MRSMSLAYSPSIIIIIIVIIIMFPTSVNTAFILCVGLGVL